MLQAFQKHVGFDKVIQEIETRDLYNLIVAYLESNSYNYSSQKQFLSALKLYLKEIHRREVDFSPVYPARNPNKLPLILSQEQVKRILEVVSNKKHLAMLTTIYALGLRSGELINLQLQDISKERKLIHIKAAKGNKDRVLPLPDKLRSVWAPYYKEYNPKHFLFEGQKGGKYTSASLLQVFKRACKKANIKGAYTVHSLRHAYATHLFDKGTDIRMIQKLLGHNDIKTTLIYTHVSQRSMLDVKSPIDFL